MNEADDLVPLDEPPDEPEEDEAAHRSLLVLWELIEPAQIVPPTLPEQALEQLDWHCAAQVAEVHVVLPISITQPLLNDGLQQRQAQTRP